MRYFCIVKNVVLSAAESAAQEWDQAGDGTGTFEQGMALSDDGGSTHTHSACNTLTSPIDTSRVLEALTNTPLFDLYRTDADLPAVGAMVQKYNGSGWTDVATGRLENVALQDAGLDRVGVSDGIT